MRENVRICSMLLAVHLMMIIGLFGIQKDYIFTFLFSYFFILSLIGVSFMITDNFSKLKSKKHD